MIQRVQSIFLFLVAAIMIATLFLPIWSERSDTSDEVVTLNTFHLVYAQDEPSGEKIIDTKDTFYLSMLSLVAAAVALFSAFKFKNRLTQMKLGALNSLLMGCNIGLSYYFAAYKAEPIIPEHIGNYEIGFFIVAAGLFFNALANRFIRKDEKLVRSADRIR